MSNLALKRNYVSKLSSIRGRPKSSKVWVGPTQETLKKKLDFGLQDVSMPTTTLSSLYELCKISDQEYEAAKFYEELAYKALGYMGCAQKRRSSLMVDLSNAGTGQHVITRSNQKEIKKWLRVRSILMNYSKKVDQVLYEILVQNRMEKTAKRDIIEKFKDGLNVLYEYCSKEKIKSPIY